MIYVGEMMYKVRLELETDTDGVESVITTSMDRPLLRGGNLGSGEPTLIAGSIGTVAGQMLRHLASVDQYERADLRAQCIASLKAAMPVFDGNTDAVFIDRPPAESDAGDAHDGYTCCCLPQTDK